MDETLCLDDLLRLDDEEVEEEVLVDDITAATTLEDDDPDLWDLEQKLIIGNTASVAAAPAVIVAVEDDESETTRPHADSELSLSKLQQENIKLQQQMNDLQTKKSIGFNSPPIEVASVDDLLQRIHDLELETARAHHVTANLLEKIQGLEQLNQKLGTENEELKESINRNLDPVETIELGPLLVVEQDGGPQNTTTTLGELKGIIENLQARIMVLVEEKLDLQLRNDRLEHELKTSPSKQQHRLPMGWFSPPPAATPRLKDDDDDGDGGGGDNDHHGGDDDDDNNGGGGEQPPHPPPMDHPTNKTTESSPSADFLMHQGAMIEKTKRDIGNALGGIFAKVASAGDFAKNRVGSKVPMGESTTLDHNLEVTVEDAIRDGEEKPGIPTNNSPITVEDSTVEDGNQHHHHQPEPTKSTLPNDGSPRHGGGWNFFGIIKKKDAGVVTPVTQQGGDEDDFMSSPTRDPPNQGLLPAMSSDSLPSMLDLSRTKLVHVFELDEDTIDFDGNNLSADAKENAQDQIFVPLENLDLMGDDQKSDAIVINTNDTQRTDVNENQSLQSEHKIPQGVGTLP